MMLLETDSDKQLNDVFKNVRWEHMMIFLQIFIKLNCTTRGVS